MRGVGSRGSGVGAVMFTPLPPAKTGVAHYSSIIIPALRKQLELEVFGSRPPTPDSRLPIYQLGNNPHHAWIYSEAMREPGVIVLHDLVLHHLIVEMTLARGDVEAYVEALRASHGEAGAAWARGRAAGLHTEMGNFLFPASIDVANRSRAVIVHNRYAADRLRSFGVATPIHVVPHPYEPYSVPNGTREQIRARHGFTADDRVIGLFGYLTSAKRAEVVLKALGDRLKLLIVGEPAPNIDVAAFRTDGIVFTGYVDDLDPYYAAVDRLVNLRYPTAGETSGTLIRAFAAGKLVAVSDYAQFAELPDDCVVKIPLGENEGDALADFFVRDLPDPSAAQREWLEKTASIELTVRGYLAALRGAPPPPAAKIQGSIGLFPRLDLIDVKDRTVTLRNRGDATLLARSYGEPAYRLIVKAGHYSRWLELPRDVRPGEAAVLELPQALPGGVATFHHALESVPMLDPEPFARATIR